MNELKEEITSSVIRNQLLTNCENVPEASESGSCIPVEEKSENQCNMLPENPIVCEENTKFNGVEISKLTKTQMKKYRRFLKWQELKKQKRSIEKLKNKQKRIHAKLNNIDLGPSRKELKRAKIEYSPCKIGVCIDLSFDDLMIDKDMGKTVKQILRVYTENRRAKAPMKLYLTDFNGKIKQEMSKHQGYENWDLKFYAESYLDVFPREKMVYLTSESHNLLSCLEEDKIYIIGGLVDHNAHKGLCYNKAVSQNIAHAQLPIGEYFSIKHRKVLTINQVFEILLKVSEGKSFKEALELVIPKRINVTSTESSVQSSENLDDNSSEGQNIVPT